MSGEQGFASQPVPPRAKAVPYSFQHLGQVFEDPYSWLQDKASPEVLAYLEAENAYATTMLRKTEALQEQLYHELRGRIQEDDQSAPIRRGETLYYWRIGADDQYRTFCRRRDAPGAPEQVLLDENALAEGKTYCRVALFEPSPDNTLLAYAVDTTGSLVFDLFIQDMDTGATLAGPIPGTAYTIAWASDSRTLFYVLFDSAHRPYKVLRHSVGQPEASGELVYHEADDALNVSVERTRSGAYILITARSHSTTEVRYLSAGDPGSQPRLIEPRQHWVEYYATHHGDHFLIYTNAPSDGVRSENFRLVAAPVSAPSAENWQTVLPHRDDTLIEGIDAFREDLVVYERCNGLRQIRISDPDGLTDVRYIAFPEPAYTFSTLVSGLAMNPEFDTRILRFEYSSLVTPDSTIDYDLAEGVWEVKKQKEIPSGYDAKAYTSERWLATAPDGARVPVSLVYRKDVRRDGSHPLLLYGYGAYGYSTEPAFDTRRISLLDRGFVFALAHVRGGSELGRPWYDQGRLLHKQNSFTDFIACAEQLIARGYTSPDRLAMQGGSAGGLLVSAVTNLRPDLFKAVVALVPFTNVVTAMLDRDLPLTVPEYEQWGHPDDPDAFAYMLSYSPYENVTAAAYPHIYVKTGLNDLQVPYWDPAKWVAKLRTLKTDDHRLLLVTNMGAGHGGASGRYDHLREDAQVYAFLIDTVGGPAQP
jgi:oligopeptidase B